MKENGKEESASSLGILIQRKNKSRKEEHSNYNILSSRKT